MTKFKQQKQKKYNDKLREFEHSRVNPFPKYDW